MGGVAVGKKCKACGAKSVLVQFVKSTSTSVVGDRVRYDCSACDYRWFETPLFMQEPERESVASGWTLSQEIAHLEGLIEKFDRPYCGFDWEHVRLCFRNGIRRIRLLCDRQVNPHRTLYDELAMLRRLVDRLYDKKEQGSTRELTRQCTHDCIARIEGYTRAPLPPYPLALLDQLESLLWMGDVCGRLIPIEGFEDPGIHQGKKTVHLSLLLAGDAVVSHLRKIWTET